MRDDLSDLGQDLNSLDFPESLPFGQPGSLIMEAAKEDHRAAFADQFEYRTTRSEGSVEDTQNRKGSDSDGGGKDTMTPAQTRRKAQNRAAQRAFRERKERHVRELEHKLAQLEIASSHLRTDNARLKHELQRATMENEILRARTLGEQSSPSATPLESPTLNLENPLSAPLFAYDPGIPQESFDFFSLERPRPVSLPGGSQFLEVKRPNLGLQSSRYASDCDMNLQPPPANRAAMLPRTSRSNRLLSAQETWDYIHATPLYQRGLVDLADVVARLKAVTRERGMQGEPSFEEFDVDMAVEDAARNTSFYSRAAVGGLLNVTSPLPLEEELLPDSGEAGEHDKAKLALMVSKSALENFI